MRRFLCVTVLFVSAAVSTSAAAWGGMGHRLVAGLATPDLTPSTRAQVDALLAGEPEPTLTGIATWADALRANDPDLGRRSAPWHYVNIAPACRYDAARDCPGGDCVVEAIRTQSAILGDRTRSKADRLQALKFVVHFVGDVHQPMHAGYGHDKGGNDRQINYRKRGTNLHAFWDSGMLNTQSLPESAWVTRLQALTPAPAVAGPLPPQAGAWAEAACAIAVRPGVYPRRARIGDDYVDTHLPLAEQQLRDAGARLAQLLNATLDPPAVP
ncbi:MULTISPECIES: S1/P1 nuclease [Luteimonas]|uniref:S1/P1 nuclease n=1 Tax=Luteimonas TaxID=83614 RepID=UPI000C7D45C3|nr:MULTISPECIES: S1/P1 nuclease [Luteimonas]